MPVWITPALAVQTLLVTSSKPVLVSVFSCFRIQNPDLTCCVCAEIFAVWICQRTCSRPGLLFLTSQRSCRSSDLSHSSTSFCYYPFHYRSPIGNIYSRNRLPAPSSADSYLAGSFEKLEELQLNDTLCSWHHMQILTLSMPFLKSVELGYNQLLRLSTEDDTPAIPPHPTLHTLNLDSNLLSDWTHICASIAAYKRYPVALTISAEIQADSIQTTDIAVCNISF